MKVYPKCSHKYPTCLGSGQNKSVPLSLLLDLLRHEESQPQAFMNSVPLVTKETLSNHKPESNHEPKSSIVVASGQMFC